MAQPEQITIVAPPPPIEGQPLEISPQGFGSPVVPLERQYGSQEPAAAPFVLPVDENPFAHFVDGKNTLADKISAVEGNSKDPNSSAYGGFTDQTWLETLIKHRPEYAHLPKEQLLALRSNDALRTDMHGKLAADNSKILEQAGFAPTPGNVYLATFAGPAGAVKILQSDPNVPVGAILGDKVVKANPFLAKMTAGETAAWASKKMGGSLAIADNPFAQFVPQVSQASIPATATPTAGTTVPASEPIGQAEAAALGIQRGLTANFLDELTGLSAVAPAQVSGALSRMNGGNPLAAPILGAALLGLEYLKGGDKFAKRYQAAADASLARSKAAEQQFPKTSMAGEMLGAVAIPIGGAVRGATLTARAAQGAKVGGIYGAASGIGAGENLDQRVLGGVAGGIGGTVLGAALPAAVSGIKAIPSAGKKLAAQLSGKPPAAATPRPNADTLRASSQHVYSKLDNAGVVFKRDAINAIVSDAIPAMQKLGYDKDLHPSAKRALERLWDSRSQPLTWNELDTIRRVVMAAGKKTQDANELAIIEKMKGAIDNFVANMTAKDVLAGDHAIVQKFSPLARKLWNEASKLDRIDDLVHRAQIKASSKFSDSGLENALRSEFRILSLNKRQMRLFSADERKAIEKVAGLGAFNAARDVGRMAPKGPVSIFTGGGAGYAVGHAIGGPVGGVIGAGAVLGTGLAARKLATHLTQKNIEALQTTIANGGNSPFAQSALSQSQKTLNALMAPAVRGATSNVTREQQQFQEAR